MKQSSIDWLINHMETAYFPTFEEIEKAKQTARQMHRQEIENAVIWFDDTGRKPHEIELDVRQYYTETFNTNG